MDERGGGRSETEKHGLQQGSENGVDKDIYENVIVQTSDTVRDLVKDVAQHKYQQEKNSSEYGTLVRRTSTTVLDVQNEPLYPDIDMASSIATPGGFRRDFAGEMNVDAQPYTNEGGSEASVQSTLLSRLLSHNSAVLYSWIEGIDRKDGHAGTPTRMVFLNQGDTEEARVARHKHLASEARTRITLFKCYVATGILFLPSGFKSAGLFAALMTIAIVGFLSVYSVCLLLDTKAYLEDNSNSSISLHSSLIQKNKISTYSELGEHSMGLAGRYLVEFSTFFSQFGFCCVYFSFAEKTFNDALSLDVSRMNFVICAAMFIVPFTFVRYLSYFAIPNLISTVFVLVSLSILTVNALLHILDGEARNVDWSCGSEQTESACLWINKQSFLSFFGTSVYIFEGTAMVIPIQNSMRNPERLSGMAVWILSSITLMFCVFGGLNFYSLGENTNAIILR